MSGNAPYRKLAYVDSTSIYSYLGFKNLQPLILYSMQHFENKA